MTQSVREPEACQRCTRTVCQWGCLPVKTKLLNVSVKVRFRTTEGIQPCSLLLSEGCRISTRYVCEKRLRFRLF